jgi:hypothetical protein
MITIFGDFHNFYAKNGVLFVEKQCYDNFSIKSSILSQNRQFFANNIFKILTPPPQFALFRSDWSLQVSSFHKNHRGMSREEACLEYLKIAQNLVRIVLMGSNPGRVKC